MLEPISGQSGVGPHLKKFATKMRIINNVRLTYRHIFCCYTYSRRLESEEKQTNTPKIPNTRQCSHWSISTFTISIFISIKPTIRYCPAILQTAGKY